MASSFWLYFSTATSPDVAVFFLLTRVSRRVGCIHASINDDSGNDALTRGAFTLLTLIAVQHEGPEGGFFSSTSVLWKEKKYGAGQFW
jgi:hypothetical protein